VGVGEVGDPTRGGGGVVVGECGGRRRGGFWEEWGMKGWKEVERD
jgi:hypothetical protein